MKTSIFNQNMATLKSKFADFYKNLTNPSFSVPDMSVKELEQAGNYSLSLGGVKCALHSQYNIGREMERLFKPVAKDANQVIVIFGLGYGHCLDYIRQKRIPYKRVIVFEPCTNILYEVLKKRNVLEMLAMKDMYLHLMNIPNDMAKSLLQEAMESKIVKIIYHMSYMSLFQDIYDNVLRSFKNERISMEASINTMRSKSIEWTTQQIKSIESSFASAAALAGKFKDVPAIIASAGPSLEKHFDLLREIGDRAVIVAPGSTTRIFNAHGINAHIAMSIDSNIIQSRFYKEYKLNSILVASYRLHPETYKNFPNRIFCAILSTEYLTQYYYSWRGQKPFMINDHASVSMAAVDMLYLMGCNPIILAGQDLSYQDNRNYAGDKADSISKWQKNHLIPDVDIFGNKVFTDYGYKAMQNDMEMQNVKYKNFIKIFNATEGGLNIHGIENVNFADVYDVYIKNRKHDVGERISRIVEAEYADGILKRHIDEDNGNGDSGNWDSGNGDCGNGDSRNVNSKNGDSGDGDESITEFFQHLLEKCTETEKLISEKEAAFVSLAKLIERGVSNNRLNNEMRFIQEYDKRLFEIPFFKQVVMPNIESTLAYVRASGKHIADSGQDWEGAAIYEHTLDEYAMNFVNVFKALVIREMISEAVEVVAQ